MNKIVDKVALIHIAEKQVLTTISKSKTKFYFPGGKRENDESDLECLTREIKEELNVDIIEDSVRLFGVFEAPADGHAMDVIVKMSCYFGDFSGRLEACNEIERFEWIEFKDMHRTSAVDHLILHRLKELDLIV